MTPTKILSYIPASLKTRLIDKIVETVAEQAKKIDPQFAKEIRKLSSQAGFLETFETALEGGIQRFFAEYAEQDEDIVAAIQNEPTIWESQAVQDALIVMLKRPGAHLEAQRETLLEHFTDVLPQRINRQRVDQAITALLRCIAEELWTLPGAKEIREVYSFQFQRMSVEAAHAQIALIRQQIEATALLGVELKQTLLQLAGIAEQRMLQNPAVAGELPPPRPYQNLIPRNYVEFIGREAEMSKLLRFLSPEYGLNIITVDGIGGVGKTSLVLEAAYWCLEATRNELQGKGNTLAIPTFDAIIFTSAKQDALTAGGILPRHQAQRTLRDIFQEISRTLDRPDIIRATAEEQPKRVRDNLARQRTLLIVDNLETIEDKQGVLSFLYELPANVKVVITTRERQSITPIRLTELPEAEGVKLIRQQAEEMDVTLTDEQEKGVYRATGGVPAAIIYAVGQIASGYSAQTVLEKVRSASGDVARFCFQASVEPLRGTPAHHLLMAIALFPKSPVRDAIAHTAGYAADPITVEEGLVRLQRLSLVTQAGERYGLLPLTREYAIAELAAFPEVEKNARERWLKWYLAFVKKYGGYASHEEWHLQYDKIEEEWENIRALFNWCIEQERYHEFKELWQLVSQYANVYGYWDDYLLLWEWLIGSSERRGDYICLADALSQQAWMLDRMGRFDEADTFFKRAWELREYKSDFVFLAQLCGGIGELKRHQKRYEESFEWFEKAREFTENVLSENDRKYEDAANFGRYARLYYSKKDYDRTKQFIESALEHAQHLSWQRYIVWYQDLLANVKIKQNELEEAEKLLNANYPIMCRNKDKRGIAVYKRSFARLAKARGDIPEMRRWAKDALNDFERLGAIREADEVRTMLGETE